MIVHPSRSSHRWKMSKESPYIKSEAIWITHFKVTPFNMVFGLGYWPLDFDFYILQGCVFTYTDVHLLSRLILINGLSMIILFMFLFVALFIFLFCISWARALNYSRDDELVIIEWATNQYESYHHSSNYSTGSIQDSFW